MVTRKFDSVVMLSPFPWKGVWQTFHYFARHLARHLPVGYVEQPPGWQPEAGPFRLASLLYRSLRPRYLQVEEGLHVLSPRRLPFNRWRPVQKANKLLYRNDVGTFCQALGLRNPLLWISYYQGCLRHLETLADRTLVYHCLDWFNNAEEKELTRRAKLVLAVSPPLVEKHKSLNEQTYLVPNGVEIEWLDGSKDVKWHQEDVAEGKRILGFIGTINRHVDLTLVAEAARAFPFCELVIIGPIVFDPTGHQERALNQLRSLPNVRFLGFKKPQELFQYIKVFDVCLMPFLREEWNLHQDPLKFYQYMAAGKPVVTTPVPVAIRYQALCYVADSFADFICSIAVALSKDGSKGLAESRMAVARAHSWESLVVYACRILGEVLEVED